MEKIVTSFTTYHDDHISTFAKSVVYRTTKGGKFASLTPEMDAVTAADTDYNKALYIALGGDKEEVAQKNVFKGVLCDKLQTFAIKINLDATGDELKLLTTFFPLVKHGVKGAEVDAPNYFSVEATNNIGQVRIVISCDDNVNMYIIRYMEGPWVEGNTYKELSTTKEDTLFNDLPSGVKLSFMGAGKRTNTTLNFSAPITRILQ